VVLSIKMHPNQALCAEWRMYPLRCVVGRRR
jgi:hypothetical protein